MFCGVGNRDVEHQADDRFATDISDANGYTGWIESHKLNGTSYGRVGRGILVFAHCPGKQTPEKTIWIRLPIAEPNFALESNVDRESGLGSDPR